MSHSVNREKERTFAAEKAMPEKAYLSAMTVVPSLRCFSIDALRASQYQPSFQYEHPLTHTPIGWR